MIKRLCALTLALGLGLGVQACGDDDSGDDGGSSGSGGSNDSGSGGGNAGSGSDRAGSGSGNAGSGSGGDRDLNDCMADEMMGSGSTADCEGIEEYSECVQDMCSYEQCASRGCQEYFDCVMDAEDPCMPTGCNLPSGDCAACLTELGTCALNNCFDLIMCGETMSGGACDQLDDCCASVPEQMQMICETAASGARAAGGDEVCAQVMDAFCM